MAKTIYLDHAAATPLDKRVRKAMQPYYSDFFYNPSATYMEAVKIKRAIDEARASVAHWLGARHSEIIFTSGASEANNLAIKGIMEQYPKANIVVSAIEHESVLVPASHYKKRIAKVKADGRVDLKYLEKLIDKNTVLVSIMYANNEIGTVQPIKNIAKIIKAQRNLRGPKDLPLYFHSDATQAANYLDLHVSRLGVDLMSLNGGKIYGPKQSGALYLSSSVRLRPLIEGGGQERGIRSGTENVAGIIGFAKALTLSQEIKRTEVIRLSNLQKTFIDLLKPINGLSFNGSMDYRLPNNLHISINGVDNERLLMELDNRGIMAAAGSACSASSEEPSHVLKAIGKSNELAHSSIRFSMGRSTKPSDIKKTAAILRDISGA